MYYENQTGKMVAKKRFFSQWSFEVLQQQQQQKSHVPKKYISLELQCKNAFKMADRMTLTPNKIQANLSIVDFLVLVLQRPWWRSMQFEFECHKYLKII